MNKKTIILIAIISVISFTASFGTFWIVRNVLNKPLPETASAQQESMNPNQPSADINYDEFVEQATFHDEVSSKLQKLTEDQLRAYIFDIREQMNEQKSRLSFISTREQQLSVTQNVISEDVKELDNLRITLAALVAEIKAEQQKLEKDMLEISQVEKENLVSIAAMYDKMDPTSASKIVTSMCKGPSQSSESSSGMEDAVKILKYMTDRTKAKLLAEVANTEPNLASVLCKRLKLTVEKG